MPQVCSSQAVARPSAVKSAGHTPGREHADIGTADRLLELPGMSDRRHIGAARAEGDRSGGMADQNAGLPQACSRTACATEMYCSRMALCTGTT
jgi:hypothetical protein